MAINRPHHGMTSGFGKNIKIPKHKQTSNGVDTLYPVSMRSLFVSLIYKAT